MGDAAHVDAVLERVATPISDYVPTSETSEWLNTDESTDGNKLVAMPFYLFGIPLVWNKQLFAQAGLNPDKPPATWDEFLADFAARKTHGITPIGTGNKEGYFGSFMFKRFSAATITDPLAKNLYQPDSAKNSVWLENYPPPEIDANVDFPAGQMIPSGTANPDQAVAPARKHRHQHPHLNETRKDATMRVEGSTPAAPKPVATYSQAVRIGDLVSVAGQAGIDPDTSTLVPGGGNGFDTRYPTRTTVGTRLAPGLLVEVGHRARRRARSAAQ